MDAQKIQAALATNGAELGIASAYRHIQPQFDLHIYEDLPSTNAEVWKLLAQGATAGCVAIAQRQSAGKGQRGRHWLSEPGGLYLSLALEPDWPVSHSGQLTSLSAWGIATALNNLGLPIQIKWPNDLFFEGKKLGGILTETKLAHSGATVRPNDQGAGLQRPHIRQAVIGVGLNWRNQVPETGITLTDILASIPGQPANNKINCLEMVAALVLKGILQGAFFQQQVGSQVFMKAYAKLLTQVGKVVSLDRTMLALVGSQTPAIAPSGLWDKLWTSGVTDRVTSTRVTSTDSEPANPSGEVIGVSEEGYLQVALRTDPQTTSGEQKISGSQENDKEPSLLANNTTETKLPITPPRGLLLLASSNDQIS